MKHKRCIEMVKMLEGLILYKINYFDGAKSRARRQLYSIKKPFLSYQRHIFFLGMI